MTDPLRVIYVVCHGRSGSTLIGSLAGMLDDCVFVGEVRTAWIDGIRDNRKCGCGQPFRDCPFWQAVFARAYGGFDTDAARKAYDLMIDYHRPLGGWHLRWAAITGRDDPKHLAPYIEALMPLYRAIAEESGGRIIVDTSKHARYGLAVASLPGMNIRFVNLVRDVRGVVYSRARPALLRDGQVRHTDMSTQPRYRIATVVMRWIARNALGKKLIRRNGGLRVLYEEFARDPRPALSALADERRADDVLARLNAGDDAPPVVQHQLAGNWVRGLRLVVRDTWRTELPGWVRVLTTVLASPFLGRYRYETHRAGGLFDAPGKMH